MALALAFTFPSKVNFKNWHVVVLPIDKAKASVQMRAQLMAGRRWCNKTHVCGKVDEDGEDDDRMMNE